MESEKWIITYGDGTTEYAELQTYGKKDYFVDLNCQLWNRAYKSKRAAQNYLLKSGYKPLSEKE